MKRLITGTIFTLLLIAVILLRDVSLAFFDVFVGIASIIACYEMSNAISKIGLKNLTYVSIFYPILMYVVYLLCILFQQKASSIVLWQLVLIISLIALMFVICVLYNFIKNHKKSKKNRQTKSQLFLDSFKLSINTSISFIYPALVMGLLFVINHIQEFTGVTQIGANLGLLLLALIFIITGVTDTFAYFVGSTFGGAKLCPLISPKKTVSGAIGGIFFTILSMVLSFYIFNSLNTYNILFADKNITIITFILLGIIGSIISQIGDIFASYIKRKCGIKDFGNCLPGHGGILDRFDGIIFNAIVILIFACIIIL